MDWSIFWTAAAAIGQVSAAGITVWAVIVALRQGKAGRLQFLQSRYDSARPMLIITSKPDIIPIQQGNESYLDWNGTPPTIEVQNVGNGPALNIRSVIYGPKAISVPDASFTWKHLTDDSEKRWYHWTTYVISQGGSEKIQYVFAGPYSPIVIAETNRTITTKGQAYALNAPDQPLVSASQSKDPWCICRITITYQDIFSRKHASIYDLVFRQKWQVVGLKEDIVKDLEDLTK
jgi:hypothetical protein